LYVMSFIVLLLVLLFLLLISLLSFVGVVVFIVARAVVFVLLPSVCIVTGVPLYKGCVSIAV
jgi:hypothetical protein